jgi:hypothetical protein
VVGISFWFGRWKGRDLSEVDSRYLQWTLREVKLSTGRLSPEQQWFLDEVTRHGGLAVVVRDVGELVQVLDTQG